MKLCAVGMRSAVLGNDLIRSVLKAQGSTFPVLFFFFMPKCMQNIALKTEF